MNRNREYLFAELLCGKKDIEAFANELSAYHQDDSDDAEKKRFDRFISRLRWHINHSLSRRQKEVIKLILDGRTERETGTILGISQQVVHIYKVRAINKLRQKLDV
ncbi:MAG: hypothetical protein GF404_10170 [candidate division Zixibacteria bacterium]|nr:hypothetical protein [candidate division Zixibacteria bacterium]